MAGMLKQALRLAAFALAALWAAPVASSPYQPPRIVAVGDLHGDFAAWSQIARAAGLTDTRGRWAGGSTTLVQLGDVTDRGPDSLKIIRSLQQLTKQAPRAGGRVIVILGNHEAMNLLGDLRYTDSGEFAAFADSQSADRRERAYQRNRAAIEARERLRNPALTPAQVHDAWIATTPLGWVEHRLAWAPDGELGRWATRNPTIVKLGDTLFVHGGISAEYAKLPLDEVNRRVAAAMKSADDSPHSILTDALGPLWYRGLIGRYADAEAERPATGPHYAPVDELTAVLAAYGAKRMVIGHTPNLGGIAINGGGRLVRIDTGISRYYGGQLSWLEIVGDRLIPHSVARASR